MMRKPDPKALLSEPLRHGIITGFAGMSAAASVQLASQVVGGQPALSGLSGLITSFIMAGVASTAAGLQLARKRRHAATELEMAQTLARGDFSKSILSENQATTPLGAALSAIAEHELRSETERANAMRDAALRFDQMADALDALPDDVMVYSRDGLLVSANRAFLSRCNDLGAVVALGMTWHEVMEAIAKAPGANIPFNERPAWVHQQESLREQATSPVRFTFCNGKAGELTVIVSADGNRTEIIRDVSALVELEEQVHRSQRESRAAESIKQITLSRLSHTIRTPMTGVLAATELLAATDLDDRQRERLDIIRRSSSTLLGVVQDMFDMAISPDAPSETSMLQPEPERRSALILDLPGHDAADAAKALETIGYEVGRAESVELMTEALKLLAGLNRLPQLVKVPDVATRDLLIKQLGGSGSLQSLNIEVMTDTIAEAAPDDAPATPAAVTASNPLDVLIAESDEVSRIAFANALAGTGISFQIVGTGGAAVSIVRKNPPRAVFVDMTLPDMDGIQTAAAIRKANGGKPGLGPLVAMTSHFVNGDRMKCLANGMDGYVLRPDVGMGMVTLVHEWTNPERLKKAG